MCLKKAPHSKATIWVYSDDATVNKMLKGKKIFGLEYTYILGDFTDSLALARKDSVK